MRVRFLLTVESHDARSHARLALVTRLPYVPDVCEEIDGLLGDGAETALYLAGGPSMHTMLVVARRVYHHAQERLDLTFGPLRIGPAADFNEVLRALYRAGWAKSGQEESVSRMRQSIPSLL